MCNCVCVCVEKVCAWMCVKYVEQKEAVDANNAPGYIYFTWFRNPLSFDGRSVSKQAAEKQNSTTGKSGRWLYSPVRINTLSRTYRTRVVARYPCIMIISHLDALNPAACHRPVPSCTIFFRLARSNPLQSRHRSCRASLASSFTNTLRCKPSRRCKHGSYRRGSRLRKRRFSVRLTRIETSKVFSFYERNGLNELVVESWMLQNFNATFIYSVTASCYSYNYTIRMCEFYLVYDAPHDSLDNILFDNENNRINNLIQNNLIQR